MQTFLRSALFALFLVLLPAAAARAESLTFWVQSAHEYNLDIEFSSSDDRFWPGDGYVYKLTDYDPHSFKLNCDYGESICYGAWESGETPSDLRWGVGYQRDTRCESCCYICSGQETDLITLLPP